MNDEVIEIDLREIFMVLLANIVNICLCGIIGACITFCASSLLMDKEFKSSTRIYVLNQQDSQAVTYSDLQTGTQLTKDYVELVKSRTVTNQVIVELDLQNKYEDMKDITADKLADMISVSNKQDTRILEISVTDTNPNRAQDIADAVRRIASDHIYKVMDIEAVNVVDYANLPEKPVSPKKLKNTIIGGFLGAILCMAIVVIHFITDDSIKTPDDVEKYLGMSVLASLPYDEDMDTSINKKQRLKKMKQMAKEAKKSV